MPGIQSFAWYTKRIVSEELIYKNYSLFMATSCFFKTLGSAFFWPKKGYISIPLFPLGESAHLVSKTKYFKTFRILIRKISLFKISSMYNNYLPITSRFFCVVQQGTQM